MPSDNYTAEKRKVVIVLDDAHIFQTDELFFARERVLFNVIKSYSRTGWGKACVVLASKMPPEVAHLPDLGNERASQLR